MWREDTILDCTALDTKIFPPFPSQSHQTSPAGLPWLTSDELRKRLLLRESTDSQLPEAWEEDEEKNFKNLPLQEAYQEDKRPVDNHLHGNLNRSV